MHVQGRINYHLSPKGRQASLLANGNGRREQYELGLLELETDLRAFTIDDEGKATFDASLAPEACFTHQYHTVISAKKTWNGWSSIEWDVVPTWDDLLTFLRWVQQKERELALEVEHKETENKVQQAEVGRIFLSDPNARAEVIEEDWVTIKGVQFFTGGGEPDFADETALEAIRRWKQDQEDRRKSNRDTLAAWVNEHGTPNQRQRLAAHLLPWQEAHDAMEKHVFAPLEEFPRYERFNVEEVCVCERDGNAPCGVKFQSTDATVLNADEWDRYSAISSAKPDAQFQLREHQAKCKSRTETEMKRGVIVKITVDLLTFKREFALGGTHDLS